MIRSCALCQRTPASRSVCCAQKLCVGCLDTHVADGQCPRANELAAMTPADVKRWRKENEPEQALTTQVIAALNALPEIEFAWQGKKGGIRAHDLAPGLPDVLAYARDGATLVGVETKRNHKEGCGCAPCEKQREFGARLVGAGGVYVGNVRKVAEAVDGVRLALARARAKGAA